jgi:hypothetical protein
MTSFGMTFLRTKTRRMGGRGTARVVAKGAEV